MKDLAGYQLLELLGRGPCGAAFKARRAGAGNPVVLKMFRPGLASRPEMDSILAAARTLSTWNHPGINKVFDAAVENGVPYKVEALAEGGTLAARIASREVIGLNEAVSIVAEILGALNSIAEAGMVHGNIKPENALLDGRGGVRLTDPRFGHPSSGAAQFHAGSVWPPREMCAAPEMMTREGRVDARADIFSVGAIFFLLATGSPPRREDSPHDAFRSAVSRQVPDPRANRPALGPDWAAFIMRMMGARPEDRYASAAQALRDLEVIRGGGQAPSLAKDKPLVAETFRGQAIRQSDGESAGATGNGANGAAAPQVTHFRGQKIGSAFSRPDEKPAADAGPKAPRFFRGRLVKDD